MSSLKNKTLIRLVLTNTANTWALSQKDKRFGILRENRIKIFLDP